MNKTVQSAFKDVQHVERVLAQRAKKRELTAAEQALYKKVAQLREFGTFVAQAQVSALHRAIKNRA